MPLPARLLLGCRSLVAPSLRAVLIVLLIGPVGAAADEPRSIGLLELDREVAAAPADVDLRLRRAETLRLAGRLTDAADDLRMAEMLAPRDVRLTLERARLAIASEAWTHARALLDAHLSQTGGTFAGLVLRARVLRHMGEPSAALWDLDAAVALADDVDAHLERGRLLESLGRARDAAAAYEEGALATDAAVLFVELSRVELGLGAYEAALAHLDAARGHAPADARHWLARARVLVAAGRARDARAAYEAARSDADARLGRRTSAFALAERGEALLGLGETARAAADLDAALALAPNLSGARQLLDAVRATQGGAR